jgi:hypothetical protein
MVIQLRLYRQLSYYQSVSTEQTSSLSNIVLNQLREAADILGKSQSAVAANWVRAGITSKPYSASRHAGITRVDYKRAQVIVQRLAGSDR